MEVINYFDIVYKASEERYKLFEIGELKETINIIQNECGSCKKWLTKQCPRESQTHKVSCSENKCEKYTMTSWTSNFIETKKAKIKELSKPCINNNAIF